MIVRTFLLTHPPHNSRVESPETFESGYMAKVQGAPKAVVDLIKEAEPYEGAGNPLWRLHHLDIEDKHKLLVSVGVAQWGITTRYTMAQVLAANPNATRFSLDDMTPGAIGIERPRLRVPLEDGAVIYRIPADLRSHPVAQMHMYPEFDFEVAFGEVEAVKGQPLIPTLSQFIKFVEGFVKLFPPLFS